MEDKELYDFFKSRKQSVDEAPGDALWAKIENGLSETPQAAPVKTGSSLFGKLLILPVLGIVAAIVWMVAYNPETGEGSAKQKDAGTVNNNESTETKIVEETDVYDKYNHTDTIKNPVLQPNATVFVPAFGKLRPANAVIAGDTVRFKPDEKKLETVRAHQSKPSSQAANFQDSDNAKLKLTDNITLKPENAVFAGKLIVKDSLNPQTISFKADSLTKEKPELEIVAISTAVRQGAANEAVLIPTGSTGTELKIIETDTKTEPGRTTITIKQALTDAQFDSFTEKVKKEKAHKPGSMIIITAPGRKPFRYKVPKPVGELGP